MAEKFQHFVPYMEKVKALMEIVLQDCFDDKVFANKGIVYGHDEWPPTLEVFPTVVMASTTGDVMYSESQTPVFHDVLNVWIFAPGLILGSARGRLMKTERYVVRTFAANMSLSDTVVHCYPPPPPAPYRAGPGMIDYGGKALPGIIYTFDVKRKDETVVVTR